MCESSAASDPARSCCTPRSSSSCLFPPADAVNLHLSGWPWLCPYSALLEDTRAKPLSGCAWPVGPPAAPRGPAPRIHRDGCTLSPGMPGLQHSAHSGFVPASLYRIRQRGHGMGISWKSSDGTRHRWQIYRQAQITGH